MRRNGAIVLGLGERTVRDAHLYAFERDLAALANEHADTLVREMRLVPGRRFRADYAFLGARIAVEVQGIYAGGHHGAGGTRQDCEKFSLAAAHGWRVLPVLHQQIRSGEALRWVTGALRRS